MRNPAITILKALAIILVVVAHSGSPAPVSHVAYMLCVSLFFLSAGYCFNPKYLDEPAKFVSRRFKTLYVPFVVWSTFFLLLNHFWFTTGILNEQYGNPTGGVTHPLHLHEGLQSFWSILFNMSGYDQFLCGAYWFFRALLVSSIAFLVLMKLVKSARWFRSRLALSAFVVALMAFGFIFWQVSDGLKVTGLAQGGYREFMGIFFIAAGFLYRRFELWLETEPTEEVPEDDQDAAIEEVEEDVEMGDDMPLFAGAQIVVESTEPVQATPAPEAATSPSPRRRKVAKIIVTAAAATLRMFCSTPFLTVPLALGVLIGVLYVGTPSMGASASNFSAAILLAVSGVAGFSFVYNVARLLDYVPRLNRVLAFIGDNTLYVLLFHLLAFKFVSMLKVGVYSLPWKMIGGHPVVHSDEGSWFWILYTVVGLALPLGIRWIVKYCGEHYDINNYIALVKAIWRFLIKMFRLLVRWIAIGSVATFHGLRKGIHWACVESWAGIYNFCVRFVDTVKDGADISEDKDDDDPANDDGEEEEEEDEYEEYDEEEEEEEEDVRK